MENVHAEDRPNVILILADDFAPGDFASSNGGLSRTPNLDQLARESVRFGRAYSASCVCAPARAALLTGRYPHRTGVVTLNMNRYPQLTRLLNDEKTIGDVFKANGYVTGLIGKWHCGTGPDCHPLKRGFDEYEGFHGSQNLSYFRYTLDVNGQALETRDCYLTDDLSHRAIGFVRRHQHRPFFLHLAHYAPHRPLEAPADLIESYKKKGLNDSTATIYAMIEVMDRGIGELLGELERLQLASRTVVIFASDNGPDPVTGTRFNQGLRGTKYEVYEGGIRVPLMIRWPDVFKSRQCDELVQFVDLFPTILDLCGIIHPAEISIDGVSFRDLLEGSSNARTMPRFWQWNRGVPNYTHNAAVRCRNWKLIKPFVTRKVNPDDSTESPVLYDLSRDPAESTDVSTSNPDRYKELLLLLDRWSKEVELDRTRKRSPQ